jgi:tRNA(adenine34) deaminase
MGRTDDELMGLALDEAGRALAHGDVPVGALIVVAGEVAAARHNERELQQDPTAHAEILALRDAAAALGRWRLADATLVVTLEPCAMCAGALVGARVERVVVGARDLKAGACCSLYGIGSDPRLNHEFALTLDVRAEECASLLSAFFAERR